MITLPAVAAAILVSSVQARALSDTSARIRGAAISDFNGRPIAGVMISAPEVKKFVVTDSAGQFVLAGLPAGKRAIRVWNEGRDRKSTRLNSSHLVISYAVFCLKKKNISEHQY